MVTPDKKALIKQLQSQINAMQGLGKLSGESTDGFAPFADAFPERTFPKGVVHEFISHEPAHAASTHGFIAALAGKLLKEGGLCLWIVPDQSIFATGLPVFGLPPDRIVFIRAPKPKDALWIIEEALKCEALTAVIAQIKELGFTESRRLQLAVERSGVTGFVHRFQPFSENAVACTTRWRIVPLPSQSGGLPGVGHSCWEVQLLKVKNGRPRVWQVGWEAGCFVAVPNHATIVLPQRHAV